MSLRDYFAAKALNGLMMASLQVDSSLSDSTITVIAEHAYKFADAMLSARKS